MSPDPAQPTHPGSASDTNMRRITNDDEIADSAEGSARPPILPLQSCNRFGDWRMELHGAGLIPEPGARVAGLVTIDWIENGVCLVMRQGDWDTPPAAVWIIGGDADRISVGDPIS